MRRVTTIARVNIRNPTSLRGSEVNRTRRSIRRTGHENTSARVERPLNAAKTERKSSRWTSSTTSTRIRNRACARGNRGTEHRTITADTGRSRMLDIRSHSDVEEARTWRVYTVKTHNGSGDLVNTNNRRRVGHDTTGRSATTCKRTTRGIIEGG